VGFCHSVVGTLLLVRSLSRWPFPLQVPSPSQYLSLPPVGIWPTSPYCGVVLLQPGQR
jgi:hypothetical protein